MNKFTKLLTFAFLGFSFVMNAQEPKYCGTYEAMDAAFKANPSLKAQYLREKEEIHALAKQEKTSGAKSSMATVRIIPIVFHIIHQNGGENISDAQVQDAVRVLNTDYRKLNADTATVMSEFKPIIADCEIEFRLAQKDPNGACTNGIDRIFSSETNVGDDGSKLNPWPRNKYLNVWVVKTISSGAAGYFAGYWNPSTDGIMILSTYVGSIGTGNVTTSRALTHEIGHYLSLDHVWGATNNPGVSCGDDGISDTPITKGFTTCALNASDVCTPGVKENLENYMDYSYCSKMFTEGQKTDMRAMLNSTTGQRNSLWTTTNLAATGVSLPAVLCKSDFKTNITTNTVCQGDSLTFTDISWNGNPTSWNWTFPGGTPGTSTDSVPTIYYNTAGLYNVTLTVGDASGTVTTTKPSFVTVNSNTATFTGSALSESFESITIPNSDWQVHNFSPSGNTWVRSTAAATTGTASVMINNLAAYTNYIDELIGPSVDMRNIAGSSPTMTFKTAYAQRTSTSTDKLQVFISTNCGRTWSIKKTISAAALATGGIVTTNFVPTSAQWATQTLSLTSYAAEDNLYFMFRFTGGGGNNIYIDDINIKGTVTTGIDELANSIDFNIFPNPIDENTIVYFNLMNKQNVNIKVLDVLGREVSTIFNGDLNEGEHQYSIGRNSNLSSGVYFVKVTTDGKSFSKKLMVK